MGRDILRAELPLDPYRLPIRARQQSLARGVYFQSGRHIGFHASDIGSWGIASTPGRDGNRIGDVMDGRGERSVAYRQRVRVYARHADSGHERND
jgi:hypothetical protein